MIDRKAGSREQVSSGRNVTVTTAAVHRGGAKADGSYQNPKSATVTKTAGIRSNFAAESVLHASGSSETTWLLLRRVFSSPFDAP